MSIYKLPYSTLTFKTFSVKTHLLLSTRLHCTKFQKAEILKNIDIVLYH